ncbi:MAG TPA: hypothetical protein VFY49_09385 [Myxococcota bacterium]|nr:hypothetical protein [Myxococcota bacterium]
MNRQDLSLLVGLTLFGLVGAYVISVWSLIARIQGARPDLYERLERPTALFSPLSAGTWKLFRFILTGLPDPSSRGVRGAVWATRVQLALSLLALFAREWAIERLSN